MNKNNLFNKELIAYVNKAVNKIDVLKEIARLAKKSSILKNFSEKQIFNLLKIREESGSTAIGEGIAIPHCIVDNIKDFVVGILITTTGIDFGSQDSLPSRLFFFIIGPRQKRNQHIQILSAFSKLIKTTNIAKEILESKNPEKIALKLFEKMELKKEPADSTEKCLLQIFIQREEYFNEILEILSAEIAGSLSILEANNASHYLHALPLFSTYWSSDIQNFNRIIICRVDKTSCNDIIRRINLIADTLKENPGVMITLQDLSYTSGSLDY